MQRKAALRQHPVDDSTPPEDICLAAIAAAGTTPNLNAGVANMILELGKVSVETKGPPFAKNTEVYNGQIRLYQDL